MSNKSNPTLSFNARPGFTGQSSDTQHAMRKQSHAGWTAVDMAAAPVTHDQILQSSEQTTQVLWKKQSRPRKRAKGPTYEAGFPACTQGAVGRVMTGLRVGGQDQRSN